MRLMTLIVAVALVGATPAAAEFPERRPIRVLTPYGAGGGIDIAARILSAVGERHVGTRVEVVNMPGAGGMNAMVFVHNAEPDGHTLVISDYGPLVTLPLRERTPYDADDWVPLFQVTEIAPTLVVRPDFPDPTFEGWRQRAIEKQGRMHVTHGAYMSSSPLPLLRLEQISDIRTNHVPTLGGGETLQFLLASIVEMAITNSSSIASSVQAGRVIPLAVPTAERVPELPDTPTFTELGYDVVMPVWYTIFASAKVPEYRREILAERIEAAYASEEARQMARRANIYLRPLSGDALHEVYVETVQTVTETIQALDE